MAVTLSKTLTKATERELLYSSGIQGWSITKAEDGHLACSAHQGKTWCHEMEQCIKENDDALLIWPQNVEPASGMTLAVPIIPSKDQWADCILELKENVRAYKIWFKAAHIHGFASLEELMFIGFLHRGEGRAVVRSILLDYLRMQWEVGVKAGSKHLLCANKLHSFKAQMAYEQNIVGHQSALVETWSILNTGNCLTCVEGSVDDFDDLIPDAGGKKW